MEYIYAALLLNEAKKEITKENLNSIIKAAGLEVNDAKAEAIAEALKGVDINELIKNASVVAPAAQAAPAQHQEAKKEEKHEEKKSEEEAASGLASLFG